MHQFIKEVEELVAASEYTLDQAISLTKAVWDIEGLNEHRENIESNLRRTQCS